MNAESGPDCRLKAEVKDGELLIRIGVKTLAWSAKNDGLRLLHRRDRVDVDLFAVEVCRELQRENEIGETMLTDLLDVAMQKVINNGPISIDFSSRYCNA